MDTNLRNEHSSSQKFQARYSLTQNWVVCLCGMCGQLFSGLCVLNSNSIDDKKDVLYGEEIFKRRVTSSEEIIYRICRLNRISFLSKHNFVVTTSDGNKKMHRSLIGITQTVKVNEKNECSTQDFLWNSEQHKPIVPFIDSREKRVNLKTYKENWINKFTAIWLITIT